MDIAEIISFLETIAPPSLQEHYDNAGLLTGDAGWECKGIITTLDATREVIDEAIEKKCNLVVAHHPIIFSGLKKINGKNYVEQAIIKAIKNDIAIYAIHTNLDNVIKGVNDRIADKLGLINRRILANKEGLLKKLFVFAPADHAAQIRDEIFAAGAGHIGNYSECSFNSEGTGTFKGSEGTDPFVGKPGERHHENEVKIEVIFPAWLESRIISSMIKVHPYEEVAYDIIALSNAHHGAGSGLIGNLKEPISEDTFLTLLKDKINLKIIRHTRLLGKPVKTIALCGGAGSFLISRALAAGADAYISSDIKYHEFFDANDKMLIADIGHWESEQFTTDLLAELLQQKFPTFAVQKSDVNTNPVFYFK